MTSENLKKLMKQADDTIAEMAREWEETGALRHLQGKPLNLTEDDEWIGARVIKDQGYSHPLLERARELEEPQKAADLILERLRRRRSWLTGSGSRASPEDIHAFNERRRQALTEYEAKLKALNTAILGFNLGVPLALHRPLVAVAHEVARAAGEIPALECSPPQPPPRRRRLWQFGARRKRW